MGEYVGSTPDGRSEHTSRPDAPIWPTAWPVQGIEHLDQGNFNPLPIPIEHIPSQLLPRDLMGRPDFAQSIEPVSENRSAQNRHTQNIAGAVRRTWKKGLDDHLQHLQARIQSDQRNITLGKRVKTVATFIVEMIPGGLGPYGIGDLTTAIEAIAGRTIDGIKLSWFERGIYAAASAIPVVPARPFVSAYRWGESRAIDFFRARLHQQQ